MITKRIFLPLMALVALVATAPLRSAEPPTGITVVGPSGAPANFGLKELAELPTIQVQTNFLTENGPHSASFEGPLLWTVLQKAGAVDPAKHREQVSQMIMVLGRDGYRAVLAVGEITPEFEAKQVILAERMDGKPLDADHLRVIVPLDKRGGRSVRDVTRIEVATPSLTQ
jgi:DMSO/TMAO reductase YedYZ molybdopterin-dependent catalytic subunit